MKSSLLRYEKHDSVAVITMDDGKANVLSPSMLGELSAAFDRAETEAAAVILTGRPGRFCAGFDLKIMMTGPEAAMSMIFEGGELFLRLYEFPKPLVMAVSGHALAGGVLLAATGDTRIGIHGDFKLGLNEVSNAMAVPILAHELARDRLTAAELIPSVLQAKIYDPESAMEAGWLDRLVDGETLATQAMTEASCLAKLPGPAYSATKRSLRRKTIAYIRQSMEQNIAELTGKLSS